MGGRGVALHGLGQAGLGVVGGWWRKGRRRKRWLLCAVNASARRGSSRRHTAGGEMKGPGGKEDRGRAGRGTRKEMVEMTVVSIKDVQMTVLPITQAWSSPLPHESFLGANSSRAKKNYGGISWSNRKRAVQRPANHQRGAKRSGNVGAGEGRQGFLSGSKGKASVHVSWCRPGQKKEADRGCPSNPVLRWRKEREAALAHERGKSVVCGTSLAGGCVG